MSSFSGRIAAGGVGVLLALSAAVPAHASRDDGLRAIEIPPITVAAGETATTDVRVRNSGSEPVQGAVLSILIDRRMVANPPYRNCSFDLFGLTCVFDTTLDAGVAYGLSEPLRIRPPADSIAGSAVSSATVSWAGGTVPARGPQDGPELGLRRLADAPPDYDDWLGGPWLDVTVNRGQSADLAVSAVQDGSAVRVTLANHGPGRLRPRQFGNNGPSLRVTFPKTSVVTSAPPNCYVFAEQWIVECELRHSLAAGRQKTFTLAVRPPAPGTVTLEKTGRATGLTAGNRSLDGGGADTISGCCSL